MNYPLLAIKIDGPLVIAIVLAGLSGIISLFQLFEDTNEKYKKLIAGFYLVSLILAIGLVVGNAGAQKKVEDTINNTFVNTDTIKGYVSQQIASLDTIARRADSLGRNMNSIVNVGDSLSKQMNRVNERFSKQLDYDKKALEERGPNVVFNATKFTWYYPYDTINPGLQLCINNFGHRSAKIIASKAIAIATYKNGDSTVIRFIPFGAGCELTPYDISDTYECQFSLDLFRMPLSILEKRIYIIAIYTELQYQDILTGKIKKVIDYFQWTPVNQFSSASSFTKKTISEWLKTHKI